MIDGFDDWLPPAAALAMKAAGKLTTRQVINKFIADFYFPEGVQQSTDEIVDKVEQIFVHGLNAFMRDPKTGERIGRAREKDKPKNVAPPKPDPVRQKKAERRQAKNRRNNNHD